MSVRFGHWLGFCRTPPPRRRRCICSDHPRTHRAPGRRARHRVLVGRGRCRRPGVSQNGRPARASSSLIWWFSSAMMPTVARLVAVNAAVTVAAVASCSVPRAARISRVRAAILRCRPPLLSADWIAVRLSRAPCSGRGPAPAPRGRRRGRGPQRPPGRQSNWSPVC